MDCTDRPCLASVLLTREPPAGLWLLCGPPASGKSSFRRHWWAGPVVSPDELRLAIFGVAFDPRREGIVWLRVRQAVGRSLTSGKGVLLDATNVSRAARRPWIRLALDSGVKAYAIACWDPDHTPLAELLRRNAERSESVPAEKVTKLAAAWEPPSRAEGLEAVWAVVAP